MASDDAAGERLPENAHCSSHMQVSIEELPPYYSNANINEKDDFGETLLLQSIRVHACNDFILSLIQKGSDLNISNEVGETALHLAVLRSTLIVSRELIKRGVNINAQDDEGRTPLHDAVEEKNLQAVCMLLYYGADVNIVDEDELTPFMYAFDKLEIAEILFPFYDDLSYINVCSCIAPYAFTYYESPIAFHLLETNVRNISTYKQHPLAFSLYFESARLFKLIWKKFDYENFYDQIPLLSQYVISCDFSASEFLECLYLMLQSSFALDLMRDCMNFMSKYKKPQYGFFYQLLRKFNNKNIKQKNRIAVCNVCFYLGAKITNHDINFVYETYGFNKELEVFIYNMKPLQRTFKLPDDSFLAMPTFILALESGYAIRDIVKLLINYVYLPYRPNILKSIGYFFLPHRIKCEVYDALEMCWDKSYQNRQILHERLAAIPKVPSLLELSRNQARKFIKQRCVISTPYCFHDIVKSLDVPQCIKDIICFKRPVYM